MRAWPVARSIFDAPLGVREVNERTTGWIMGRQLCCRAARNVRTCAFKSKTGMQSVLSDVDRASFEARAR